MSCSQQTVQGLPTRLGFVFFGLLLEFLLAASLQCYATDEVLTPHRVAALRQIVGTEISPDGNRVAYLLSVPRIPGVDEDGEPWTELWVVADSEGGARPFVTGKVNVGSVQWSADARQIAFLAKRGDDKNKSVYLIPVDGGEARKAAELSSEIISYSLAPDGVRVALVASEPEKDSLKKLRDKGFNAEIYEEDWHPARIWISELFGSPASAVPLPTEGHVHHVEWSPIDDRLLVAAAPSPAVDDSLTRRQARIVDSKTGIVLARIDTPGKLGRVGWSSDGRLVALIAGADVHDPEEGRLMVANASDGSFRDVLPGLEGSVTLFGWAGAESILYVAAKGVRTELGGVNAITGERVEQPLLGPSGTILTGFSLSTNGQRAAFIANSLNHPAELFTWNAGDCSLNRRTKSNPMLEQIRFARQEVIRHKARDGLELEGVFIHPLDEADGRRYPLILTVHGGPESHVSDGWLTSYNLPGQVAAARGMAVFYPNYRGSTGRGVAFSKLGQGDAAGKEFDDLVDAVDHLISIGLVDREKVGVTGGSYGGYATAWCCTRYSDRFAAGVMFVGISDKVSKVGTTDIPNEEYNVHALKRPWEDWQFLLERSPIYHAAQGRTPLLILHGKDDPRVNVGQSRELHRHLKLHDQTPVRLVLYPGEVHGNRKAAARLDYSLRMMRWMEHYLKGPGGAMPPVDLDYQEQPSSAKERRSRR